MNYATILKAADQLAPNEKSRLVSALLNGLPEAVIQKAERKESDRNDSVPNKLPSSNEQVENNSEFTVSQSARALGVSVRTVSRWFDAGRLRGYRFTSGHDLRIAYDDLVHHMQVKGLSAPEGSSSHCFTSGQAAKILGVSSRTLLRRARTGKIKCYFVPGRQERRIYSKSLQSLLAK